MRRTMTIILALGVFLVGVPSVFAAGVQETSEDAFIDRFETALENSNFTEEEVEEIMASADDLAWERTERADAAVVVQALAAAREEQADLEAEEHAHLALALAQNAGRLRDENYDEEVVNQAILEAVRSQLAVINEWREGDKSEQLGELIRSGVSTEAREFAQERKSDNSRPGEDTPAGDAKENSPNGNGPDEAEESRPTD